jgi:hypothetical protein
MMRRERVRRQVKANGKGGIHADRSAFSVFLTVVVVVVGPYAECQVDPKSKRIRELFLRSLPTRSFFSAGRFEVTLLDSLVLTMAHWNHRSPTGDVPSR